jgi:hypothetical protein
MGTNGLAYRRVREEVASWNDSTLRESGAFKYFRIQQVKSTDPISLYANSTDSIDRNREDSRAKRRSKSRGFILKESIINIQTNPCDSLHVMADSS